MPKYRAMVLSGISFLSRSNISCFSSFVKDFVLGFLSFIWKSFLNSGYINYLTAKATSRIKLFTSFIFFN